MKKDGMMMSFYYRLREYIGNYEYWINFLKPHGSTRPDVVDYEIDLDSIKGIDYSTYYNNPVKFNDLPQPMQKVAEACLLRMGEEFGEKDIEVIKKAYNLL